MSIIKSEIYIIMHISMGIDSTKESKDVAKKLSSQEKETSTWTARF